MLTRAMVISVIEDEVFVDGPENRIYGIEEAADAILAEMDEPLAVLADRKGCKFSGAFELNGTWFLDIDRIGPPDRGLFSFKEDSYAQAEQAARDYLLSLPDTKEVG